MSSFKIIPTKYSLINHMYVCMYVWHWIEVSNADWLMWAQNPLRISVFSTLPTNDQFLSANEDQHQVYKVTTSTVKYVENSVSPSLVFKAICANMSKSAASFHDIHVRHSDRQCPVWRKILHNLAKAEKPSASVYIVKYLKKKEKRRKKSQNSIGGQTRNREDNLHVCMYQRDLALNNLQGLICPKTQLTDL